ncbi:hypothetical protein PI125_g9756 [Phytophthora idaei]|nr:hypothetical protein PI125_g9756 [Phytophthora idaei]KAG3155947.1 hypothetical protein PI126_g8951 [Phytophthora idaei]
MNLVSTLVLLVVTLQCSFSTARLDFVRSYDHRAVGSSTLTDPTPPPVDTSSEIPEKLPASGIAARRQREGSVTGTIVVGRNGGGYEPLRDEASAE